MTSQFVDTERMALEQSISNGLQKVSVATFPVLKLYIVTTDKIEEYRKFWKLCFQGVLNIS